jgi:hypothetical protein
MFSVSGTLITRKWNTLVLAVLAEVVWFGSSLSFMDDGAVEPLTVRVYFGLTLVGMYAVPAMCLYGFPVHLLASHVTRRLPDWKRVPASLGIHLGFAAALIVLDWFVIPALFGAMFFFLIGEGCDQLERLRGRKALNRLTALLALPVVIPWLAGGAMVWWEQSQAAWEMDELRAAGPPSLVLRTEKGAVEVPGNGIAYSNVKPQPGELPDVEEMPALHPEQLPVDTPVVEAKPGETVRFAFPGIPGTPSLRLVRSEHGTPVREATHKSAFQAPEIPGLYPYVMTAEWGERAYLSFTALFAVRVGEAR